MIEPKTDSSSLLQSDVLQMENLQIFILSSKEEYIVYLKSLFSKHKKHLMKIYEQTIQSGTYKKTSTVIKRVLKIENEWSTNVPNFVFNYI